MEGYFLGVLVPFFLDLFPVFWWKEGRKARSARTSPSAVPVRSSVPQGAMAKLLGIGEPVEAEEPGDGWKYWVWKVSPKLSQPNWERRVANDRSGPSRNRCSLPCEDVDYSWQPILRVPNLAPHFCSGIHLAAGDVVLGRPKQMRLVYSMFFPAIVLTSLKPFVLYW